MGKEGKSGHVLTTLMTSKTWEQIASDAFRLLISHSVVGYALNSPLSIDFYAPSPQNSAANADIAIAIHTFLNPPKSTPFTAPPVY
jgi:hypothetical protein